MNASENTLLNNLHVIDQYLGQQLRLKRIACGMTQSVLAEKVGVTFQQLQKYESGANRMSGSRIYQFCLALNETPNYFFGELFATNEKLAEDCPHNLREGLELLKSYNNISSTPVKEALRRTIAAIAKMNEEE